mgnify:CR=1 FL=1
MRAVLDTNVFISGVFFSGPPHQILLAWKEGEVKLLVSASILDEYHRVAHELAYKYPAIDLRPFLDLLTLHAEVVEPVSLPPVVLDDPSDDMFLECAVAGGADCMVSGDRHLLGMSAYKGIPIVKPRDFVQEFLGQV